LPENGKPHQEQNQTAFIAGFYRHAGGPPVLMRVDCLKQPVMAILDRWQGIKSLRLLITEPGLWFIVFFL